MAFNPAIHTATNKPIGLVGKPVDARSYFFDATTFVYRPYADTAEVLAYLNTADSRTGQFPIIIDSAGTNTEWWFKDGVTDADLILKSSGGALPSPVTFALFAGTTVNPFIINLSSYPLFDKNASFIYKRGTDPNYTRFEDYTISETATGFSIFLHDNGSGKVAEDGVLIMKA